MDGFHHGGYDAYCQGLKEEYAKNLGELESRIDQANLDDREALEIRKSELQAELDQKLSAAERMLY